MKFTFHFFHNPRSSSPSSGRILGVLWSCGGPWKACLSLRCIVTAAVDALMETLSLLFWGKKRLFRRIFFRFYRPTVLPPGPGTSLRREWAVSVAFLDESSRQVLLLRPCTDGECCTHPVVVRVWCGYYIAIESFSDYVAPLYGLLGVSIAIGDCRRRLSKIWICLKCKLSFVLRNRFVEIVCSSIHIYLCDTIADESNYKYVTVQ